MEKLTVLVPNKVRPFILDELGKLYEVKERTKETTPEMWDEWLLKADALYSSGSYAVTEAVLAKAPKLKVISQVSMGYDNIDIKACTNKGIRVGNTPGVVTESTADAAFALILCSARYMHNAWLHVKNGEWGERKPFTMGVDLFNKTLGIIGMGKIGLAIAKRAIASGMKIVYHNNFPSSSAAEINAVYMSLDALLQESDFVITTVPLTEKTRKMIGKNEFEKMKPTARFINAARGEVVDSDALYEALKEKKIAYAALDVTDPEPLKKDDKLLTLDNIVVFPHIGTNTFETKDAMSVHAFENLKLALQGENMLTCINSELEK